MDPIDTIQEKVYEALLDCEEGLCLVEFRDISKRLCELEDEQIYDALHRLRRKRVVIYDKYSGKWGSNESANKY